MSIQLQQQAPQPITTQGTDSSTDRNKGPNTEVAATDKPLAADDVERFQSLLQNSGFGSSVNTNKESLSTKILEAIEKAMEEGVSVHSEPAPQTSDRMRESTVSPLFDRRNVAEIRNAFAAPDDEDVGVGVEYAESVGVRPVAHMPLSNNHLDLSSTVQQVVQGVETRSSLTSVAPSTRILDIAVHVVDRIITSRDAIDFPQFVMVDFKETVLPQTSALITRAGGILQVHFQSAAPESANLLLTHQHSLHTHLVDNLHLRPNDVHVEVNADMGGSLANDSRSRNRREFSDENA